VSLFVEYESQRKVNAIFRNWRSYDEQDSEKSLHLLQSILELDGVLKTSIDISDNEHRINSTQTMLDFIDYKSRIISGIFSYNSAYKFPEKIYEEFSRYPNWRVRFRIISNSHIPLELLWELSEKDRDPDVKSFAYSQYLAL
jgi:hypothetical protein